MNGNLPMILAICVGLLIGVWQLLLQRQQRAELLEELKSDPRFEVLPAGLFGTLRLAFAGRHRVEIRWVSRDRNRPAQWFFRSPDVRFAHRSTLIVKHQLGVLGALGKLLGVQDVLVGDTTFDDAFVIKASHPYAVRAAFEDPRLRDAMTQLAHLDGPPPAPFQTQSSVFHLRIGPDGTAAAVFRRTTNSLMELRELVEGFDRVLTLLDEAAARTTSQLAPGSVNNDDVPVVLGHSLSPSDRSR